MDYSKMSFPDVVSLKVQNQMWIILIITYNPQIMPIILPIMHHNPHNPWIIVIIHGFKKKLMCTPWVLSELWGKTSETGFYP